MKPRPSARRCSPVGRGGPDLILTCGGLGPTADDLTVAAIAAAVNKPLHEHPQAYAMIRDFYALLYARGDVITAELTPARAKMAQMPSAAEPLTNTVGAAPGVLLQDGSTLIVSLPGVPAEMKDIFTHACGPGWRRRSTARLTTSAPSPPTAGTNRSSPPAWMQSPDGVAVYVKSRAQVYGSGVADFITLAARRDSDAAEVRACSTRPKRTRA